MRNELREKIGLDALPERPTLTEEELAEHRRELRQLARLMAGRNGARAVLARLLWENADAAPEDVADRVRRTLAELDLHVSEDRAERALQIRSLRYV